MGILPIFLYSFSKRYTGSAPGANVSVIGLNAIGTTGWPPPFAQLSFFEASISAPGGLNDREPAPGSIAALLFRTGRWSSRSGSRETRLLVAAARGFDQPGGAAPGSGQGHHGDGSLRPAIAHIGQNPKNPVVTVTTPAPAIRYPIGRPGRPTSPHATIAAPPRTRATRSQAGKFFR